MAKQKKQPKAEPAEPAPTTCRNCGSTKREPYRTVAEHRIDGVHNGHVYNSITWQRTKCSDCGLNRVDRSYEMRAS